MAKKPMGKSGVADTGYSEVLTYPSTEICQTPSGELATIPTLVGHGQVFAVPGAPQCPVGERSLFFWFIILAFRCYVPTM